MRRSRGDTRLGHCIVQTSMLLGRWKERGVFIMVGRKSSTRFELLESR